MIEAMACGTPVIAFRSGSVPEVIDDGVSGYVVDSIDEAVKAVSHLSDLDRSGVRGAFEERFTAERMAKNYIKMYQSLIGHTRHEIGHPRRPNGHDVGMQVRV
jgi:glycosyltransferase involved in cell wall biosynthesis